MHKKLIVGNLKMNPLTPTEFGRYLDGLEKDMKGKRFEKTEIVVCPPAVYFRQFVERKMKDVKLGAQDVYWEYQGAFTGEISAGMMKANGAQYSIVGHSERRKYFGENEEIINLKLKAILKSGLNAILCIGESGEERKSNQTAPVLKKQLEKSLAGIGVGKSEYITIAYEPIWAVGTDKIPSSDEVLEAKIIIKKILTELYSRKAVEKMRILYGGSVKSHCAGQVCVDPAMDGALIGRESLTPYDFIKIAKIIDEK
ncbi:MAG: triose-phosphate isomerase [Candidatus Moranbacteria bacterium RIFOXYB1_FULL_43_19]|nr:MAG: triose-phosphate isomerase [Candidatus Moranbacteria bacterium RIFOXYB1_FULL_43_19]OGI34136.1 MAG: triose-phosphate isomerase [Candidatus Moranbacteria bacterium RIFOXYC1_FULL_44_13]OGI38324.1 MAG: triose-phosphate isomerase [Candidatus Moranbacteria bacterium RIFOXYD1_FULL_44_12]